MSCGDVSFDYLEALVTVWGVPLLYVPGNHDPDLSAPPAGEGGDWWASPDGLGPGGCTNIDGRIAEVGGVRFAGLGGCLRYRPGPNQYTERAMRLRGRILALRLAARRRTGPGKRVVARDQSARAAGATARDGGSGRTLDVLITHAPPRGCGDEEDPAHRGFASFHEFVARTGPRLLLHGHIHPYGLRLPDRQLGDTEVVNAVPYRLITLGDEPLDRPEREANEGPAARAERGGSEGPGGRAERGGREEPGGRAEREGRSRLGDRAEAGQ